MVPLTQNSIHRAISQRTLAIFLHVETTYGSIGADIAAASLPAMSIRCLLTHFLGVYLESNCVSSYRLQDISLPQGTVLSTLWFYAVMTWVAPSLFRDHLLSTGIYADDICLWSLG